MIRGLVDRHFVEEIDQLVNSSLRAHSRPVLGHSGGKPDRLGVDLESAVNLVCELAQDLKLRVRQEAKLPDVAKYCFGDFVVDTADPLDLVTAHRAVLQEDIDDKGKLVAKPIETVHLFESDSMAAVRELDRYQLLVGRDHTFKLVLHSARHGHRERALLKDASFGDVGPTRDHLV